MLPLLAFLIFGLTLGVELNSSFGRPLPVLPIVGRHSTEGGPESLCRIDLHDSKGNYIKLHCSATLVSPDEIITAKHCLDDIVAGEKNERIVIHCGYAGFNEKKGIVEMRETHHPKEILFGEEQGLSFLDPGVIDDVARIKLRKPSALRPMRIVRDQREVERLFSAHQSSPQSKCRIAGYGLGPNAMAGKLRNMPATKLLIPYEQIYTLGLTESLPLSRGCLEDLARSLTSEDGTMKGSTAKDGSKSLAKLLDTLEFFPGTFINGDSGGALYCRLSPDTEEVLAGIISNFMVDPESYDDEKLAIQQYWSFPFGKAFKSVWPRSAK